MNEHVFSFANSGSKDGTTARGYSVVIKSLSTKRRVIWIIHYPAKMCFSKSGNKIAKLAALKRLVYLHLGDWVKLSE